MTMTCKERIQRALDHKPIDHVPTQVNYTRVMGSKIADHFGLSTAELPKRLNNHMIRVDITYESKYSPDGRVMFDWWGVGFDTQEEGYFPAINPLAETEDLIVYPWPDPHDPHLLDQAAKTIAADQGEHFIIPNFGFALFERAWTLRGFETFLLDMALNPCFAEDLLEQITDIQLVLINRFIKLGVDGAYFGDDYGGQNNMLFSPRMWRKMLKPRLARMFAPFRDAGLPVLLHSDGQIAVILPDLIEIGLTTYNPVQPEVIDHSWLKSTFGARLAYYGGISTQTVLPNGTPEEVKENIKRCVDILAPQKTGLLIAPSHRLMSDIPMENIEALFDGFALLEAGYQ